MKPVSFAKHQLIFTKHQSTCTKHWSLLNINWFVLQKVIHRSLLNIDQSLLNIDWFVLQKVIHWSLLNIDTKTVIDFTCMSSGHSWLRRLELSLSTSSNLIGHYIMHNYMCLCAVALTTPKIITPINHSIRLELRNTLRCSLQIGSYAHACTLTAHLFVSRACRRYV